MRLDEPRRDQSGIATGAQANPGWVETLLDGEAASNYVQNAVGGSRGTEQFSEAGQTDSRSGSALELDMNKLHYGAAHMNEP